MAIVTACHTLVDVCQTASEGKKRMKVLAQRVMSAQSAVQTDKKNYDRLLAHQRNVQKGITVHPPFPPFPLSGQIKCGFELKSVGIWHIFAYFHLLKVP